MKKSSSTSLLTTEARQRRQALRDAARKKSQTDRATDIVASLKAGVPLSELGRRYQITMERVRQIARAAGYLDRMPRRP